MAENVLCRRHQHRTWVDRSGPRPIRLRPLADGKEVSGYGLSRPRRGRIRRARGGGCERTKKGARPTLRGGELAGPIGVSYSVCSSRNAWAFSDCGLAAEAMLRRARVWLAAVEVLAPRTGTWWSRYSVTAL